MNRTGLVRYIKDKAFSFVTHIYLISAFLAFWLAVNQYKDGKADEIGWVSYALLSPIALALCFGLLLIALQFLFYAGVFLGASDVPPFSGWYKHYKEKTERDEELAFRRKVLDELAECKEQLRDLQSRLGANRSLNHDRWMGD